MSAGARRGSRTAAGRTTGSIWLDRLLLGAHAAIALLAVGIVADACAGGRLVPWPPGGPLGPALVALALALLLAGLPWRPSRGHEPGPDDGTDATSTNRRGRPWRSRRRSATGS